jgi:hypothetical protein
VEVSSDSDSVVGTISFTDSNDDYLAAMELSGTPLKDFVIPLASNNSIYSTELSLLNAGAVAAQVTFELWGLTSGTTPQAVTNPVTLQPGRNMVALMSDLFPGVSASTANIRVHSTQPLHSFAIISDRQLRFMSSVPAIEIPVQ